MSTADLILFVQNGIPTLVDSLLDYIDEDDGGDTLKLALYTTVIKRLESSRDDLIEEFKND